MKSAQEIDKEIDALHQAVEQKRSAYSSKEALSALEETKKDVNILQDSWNFSKEEQQHLFEETRRNFEAQVYKVVQQLKTIDEKYSS